MKTPIPPTKLRNPFLPSQGKNKTDIVVKCEIKKCAQARNESGFTSLLLDTFTK